jgi:hypothetical protein
MLYTRDGKPIVSGQSAGKVSQEILMIVTWTCFAVAATFWTIRVIIRLKLNSKLNLDDFFATLGLCILLAHAIVLTEMAPSMYDILRVAEPNSTFVPPADFMERSTFYLKCQFAATCLFWSCLWAVKASFMAFYKKLTEGIKGLSQAWWAVAVFIFLAYLACIISYPVSCTSFILGRLPLTGEVEWRHRLT